MVPTHVLNPAPAAARPRSLELAEGGWGVVALPQPGLPREMRAGALLAAIADQLATFLDDGYEVALAGPTTSGRRGCWSCWRPTAAASSTGALAGLSRLRPFTDPLPLANPDSRRGGITLRR